MQLKTWHNGNDIHNATCEDTQISPECPYCPCIPYTLGHVLKLKLAQNRIPGTIVRKVDSAINWLESFSRVAERRKKQ